MKSHLSTTRAADAANMMQLAPGVRIGGYEVISAIAAGGMGEVYRARDTMLGRDVAVKVLTRAFSADPEYMARFEREARAVAALSHPNVLAIYSFGHQNGIAYAVTELLEGRTLREELQKGVFAVRRAIDVGSQIALGLAAAHEKGLVHRDVKPENVFVTSPGVVKLLDFGLAKAAAEGPPAFIPYAPPGDAITSEGVLIGTVGYMSPEQVSGAMVDLRSDLFCLGIVLYEMLTGQRPFRGKSAVETLNATVSDSPPPMAALAPGVPLPLERIVMRCLEKSPAARFQSARDLAFALSTLATPTSVLSATGTGPVVNAAANRYRVFAILVVIVALVVAAAAWPRSRPAVALDQRPLVSFTIGPPVGTDLANVPAKMLAISPNGDRIVFAVTRAGHRELWVRHIASAKAEALAGTQDASEPLWSADGQHIGFFADSKLKRVSIDGTMPVTVCDAPLEARGHMEWRGTILFADAYGGLSRVAATGVPGAGQPRTGKEVKRTVGRSSCQTDATFSTCGRSAEQRSAQPSISAVSMARRTALAGRCIQCALRSTWCPRVRGR